MANEYEISAGISPIDNSTGATAQSYYISAGLPPDDTAVAGGRRIMQISKLLNPFTILAGLFVIGVVKKTKLNRREFLNPFKWGK